MNNPPLNSILRPVLRSPLARSKGVWFSIAEAAERTGQSESLVKVNIHRGLKKLSALVEKAE